MKAILRKYAHLVPGVSLLVLNLLILLLVSTGSTSQYLISVARPGWQIVGSILLVANVVFGFLFPIDAPEIKMRNINGPVAVGLIILGLTLLLGWLCILDPGSPYAFKAP